MLCLLWALGACATGTAPGTTPECDELDVTCNGQVDAGVPIDAGPMVDAAVDAAVDECPLDSEKTEPGTCGCGVADVDSDNDSVPDCVDVSEVVDDSFGEGGQFVLPSAPGVDEPRDAVIAADGSIFITGDLSNGADSDVVLIKLTPGGQLDTGFNGTGFLTKANIAGGTSGSDQGHSVFFAPDGDLLIGGQARNGGGSAQGFLWKVSVDGQDDPDFGNNGIFLLDPSFVIGQRISAACDPATGNVFIVGASGGTSAWRVLADGSALDPTFGIGGHVNLHPSAIQPSMGVDANGNLFVEGAASTGVGASRDALSWLLDNSGTVVEAYGNPLIHADLAGAGGDAWETVIPVGDDKVLLVGNSASANADDEVIARVNRGDGSLDTTFGGGTGFWTEDVLGLGSIGRAQDAVIESDGSITALLEVFNSDNSDVDVAVVKLNPDGTRDMSFAAQEGVFLFPGDLPQRTQFLIARPDGRKLVLTTRVDETGTDIAVWSIN